MKKHLAELIPENPVAFIEHQIIMPFGEIRWQRWSDRAIFDKEGHVVEYQSVGRDITERKRMGEALQQSKERYRSLFEAVPVGIYSTTPEGLLLDANPTLVEMLGYPDLESLQKVNASDIYVNPETRKQWQEKIKREGVLRDYEVQFRKRDGTNIWVQDTCSTILDEGGRILHYKGSVKDITERKRMDDTIKESLAEKEILLREIHHRVKNNLTAIISLIDLQADTITDRRAQDMLKDFQGRLMTMALVHEDLYRSENLVRIDFGAYLHQLVTRVQSALIYNPAITVTIDAPDIVMDIDSTIPCGLIVNELVTNSLKYAFPNNQPCRENGRTTCGIIISVRKEGKQVTMRVGDNGVGLPQSIDLSTITSLGLRLVYLFGTHQLNGKVTVTTEHGTEFTITFIEKKNKKRGKKNV